MTTVRRNRKRSVNTKRKTGLTKLQSKAVRQIAKSVTLKEAETKSTYISHSSSSVYGGYLYAKNLFYPMVQGTNSETYIGEKMFLKNIHIKGNWAFDSSTASVRAKTYRMLLIRAEKLLTSSSGAITETEVFRSGSSNIGAMPSCYHTDNHKVTVLYDSGAKVINESYDSNVPIAVFDVNVKINKNVYWNADNSGVLKGGDYYVIWCAEDLAGSLVPTAKIAFDTTINFKDE